MTDDPRIAAVPDIHGHAKGEHKLYVDERPIPYTARMLFLWFFHACRRGSPRFLMVADHINYLTFEDPAAVNLVRRALKLAQAGDLYGAAETAGVEVAHANVVGEGLRRGMRYSIGAEVDNDPRSRPDAQNIVDAMRPDGIVRSVHFLPITHPQFGENWMWPFDNPEFRDLYDVVGTEQTWEIYMTTLLEAVEKLPGHIVGHFYVPGKFGHWPADDVLESYEDRLLDACAERGLAVEINTRTFYKHSIDDHAQLEKYRAVNLRLLRKAKEKGVAVAVGSDAHSPKDQGRAFSEILALLDEAEINEIAFPIDGRMARVALRATDELRQASARNGTSKDQSEIAIPGTEPEPVPEPVAESTSVAVAANGAPPAPTPAASPKKRPSRAKKPALVASEPDVAAAGHEPSNALDGAPAETVAAVAPTELATATAEAPSEPANTAREMPTEPANGTEEMLPEPMVAAAEEPARETPADSVDSGQMPVETAAPTADAPAEAAPSGEHSEPAQSGITSFETEPSGAASTGENRSDAAPDVHAASDESPAPVTALAAVAAVASAAVAAVVSATSKRKRAEPARAQPADPVVASKSSPPAKTGAPKSSAASKPVAAPKPVATAKVATPKMTLASKAAAAFKGAIAAKPVAASKAVAKAVAKTSARGAAALKASPAVKAAPAAARKRVAQKAASKKAAPARAATPVAKKAAVKKVAPARKPATKAVSKTASRASVKKTSAKKTAKKKTTKQRR